VAEARRVLTDIVIYLGRTSGGSDSWRLFIEDQRSRVRILDARLDNDTFADMLSGRLAGNIAEAEVFQAPWIGQYAVHASRQVDIGWNTDNLDKRMEQEAKRLLANDPDLSRDEGWCYTGYQGGGGGASHRRLTFVRYQDTDPRA